MNFLPRWFDAIAQLVELQVVPVVKNDIELIEFWKLENSPVARLPSFESPDCGVLQLSYPPKPELAHQATLLPAFVLSYVESFLSFAELPT